MNLILHVKLIPFWETLWLLSTSHLHLYDRWNLVAMKFFLKMRKLRHRGMKGFAQLPRLRVCWGVAAHWCPHEKREIWTQRDTHRENSIRRWQKLELRSCKPRMTGDIRTWGRHGTGSPLEPFSENGPDNTLILDFQCPECASQGAHCGRLKAAHRVRTMSHFWNCSLLNVEEPAHDNKLECHVLWEEIPQSGGEMCSLDVI
ncbi:uncharacterized protein LOC131492730 [Neofelis nebulosa]|uniref:uncharacterized protein LOC131492730 n=1 Tax=Neofelis nebulosa TaxID=61452 RepID=UPI00272BDB9C|nr:uncharacterized protein LOC131492730 [Neofelis nebulosa]